MSVYCYTVTTHPKQQIVAAHCACTHAYTNLLQLIWAL